MNEFEFTAGSLEAQGLQEGDKVECTYNGKSQYFSEGGVYPIVSHIDGRLAISDATGYHWVVNANLKFKPVSVNAQQQPQGQKLQDILPHCKDGDVLECVYTPVDVFDEGVAYPVLKTTDGTLYILSNEGNPWFSTTDILFIKSGTITNSEDVDQHDSWGIGKSYTAPKKEWQPDTLDVDLTKKIWEW